jgi:hypothetical protein
MRKIYFILLLSFCCFAKSQVFTGTGGAILNTGVPSTTFNLSVTGLANIDSLFGLEEVTIDITHPLVQELKVSLMSPSGIEVDLSGVLSCSGANFTGTTFRNGAPAITSVSAPYTGTFSPLGNLGRFNTNKPGNGTWQLLVKDFVAGPNSGSVISWSLKFGNAPAQPVTLVSSNLPLVFINTPGNQKLSANDMIVDFAVIYNGANRNFITDPKNNYNGKANCHTRGSSSKMFEKGNIKIELRDASGTLDNEASLVGMPIESDWILTSGYSDKSLMRNAISQTIFQQMGHYSPRYKFVELILNGEYFGVYMLMEQVKRGKDRVAVDKMTNLDNQFPYITGGYIIQINRTDDPGYYSLYPGISATNSKFYYQYNYPNPTDITSQQAAYIKAVTDSFETVMQGPNFANPTSGYKKFIDDASFVDFLIVNELSKNTDAYRLSTYLYKDNFMDGGKLHIGPVWDYDFAWHNCNYGNTFSELYWQYQQSDDTYPTPTWWTQLMTDNAFKDKLYCRYHSLRLSTLSNASLNQFVDATAALLDEAQKRNYRQFPILGTYVFPNPQTQAGATYATEVNDLKQWIGKRTTWMDSNIPGYCANIGFEEKVATDDLFDVFPNPCANTLSIKYKITQASKVKVELYNMIGELVIAANEEKITGARIQEISTEKLKAGTYILKMEIDGRQSYKKIIKL